jgi:hypothetical protein
MRRFIWVAIVAGGSSSAWGQPQSPTNVPTDGSVNLPGITELQTVEITAELRAAVDRLGDPSYAAREAATAELMGGSFHNAEIYAVLTLMQLTAEQRHRLLSVVRERLLNTPRGAVGIKVEQRSMRNNQIVVEELLPELPAREVLQIGDRITHLDNELLPNWDAFVRAVQSRRPGAKIAITVERLVSGRRQVRRDVVLEAEEPKFERLEIELELGSTEQLLDPVTGQPQSGGPVASARQEEWMKARSVYAPLPRLLPVGER